jgi:hypothetical protein
MHVRVLIVALVSLVACEQWNQKKVDLFSRSKGQCEFCRYVMNGTESTRSEIWKSRAVWCDSSKSWAYIRTLQIRRQPVEGEIEEWH